MLNKAVHRTPLRVADAPFGNPQEPLIDVVEIFRTLRRRWSLIASILLLAVLTAAVYVIATPPRYTATTLLVFDVRKAEPFQRQADANATADSAFVDSQVEVLKSDNIARLVIQNLNLLSDPEFVRPKGGLLAAVIRMITTLPGEKKLSTESDPLGRAVRILQANLRVKRIGLTYVVSIDYRSLDPNKAAKISDTVVDVYVAGELEARRHAARLAHVWLEDRINELKTLAQNTERAVAEYKAKANVLVEDSRQLNERQVADLSSERRLTLQDLESSAQTYRALHEALLQRIGEFTHRQSFPTTEARIVSPASPPLEKSDPKTLRAMAVACLLGLIGGIGAAFAREHFDSSLRSSDQVEKKLGIECLGMLPTISAEEVRPQIWWWLGWWMRKLLRREQADAASEERVISTANDRYRFVLHKPFSRFAETIRSLNVAVEIAGSERRKKVIGVTSAMPGEGKSLVAANLSAMMAASGSKALLIDADPRHLGLTRQLAPDAKAGVMDAITRVADIEHLVWSDQDISLDFLPMTPPTKATHRIGFGSCTAVKFLESVRQSYDFVILDLPPILPVVDVKAASRLIDCFILVIECGCTSDEAVHDALKTAPLVAEKLVGAVLNKVKPTQLERLELSKGRCHSGYYR